MMSMIAFIASITGWVTLHQSTLLLVVSALYAFEQWLGSTEVLKSNSSLQLVGNFISGLLNIFSLVYKVATGKALVVPVDAPATPAELIQRSIESPATVLSAGVEADLANRIQNVGAELTQSKLEEK